MTRLSRRSYSIDAPTLAQRLLGATLVRVADNGVRLAGRIVETEAYCGPEDQAAHSYKARRTERTEPMFGVGGTSYVYFTYGMHHCMNIVAGRLDEPVAVLLRALEPTEGLEEMRTNRRPRRDGQPKPDDDLCSGPAKLCQAMGIDRLMTGLDMTTHDRLWVEPRARAPRPDQIVTTTRVGIDNAGDWVDAPLRWYLRGSPHVSVRDPEAERRA
ncbi:MAG: DNA-3-methyladenine glycosylase [Planctomycetota bacterium]